MEEKWLIIILVVLVLVCAGLVFIFSSKNEAGAEFRENSLGVDEDSEIEQPLPPVGGDTSDSGSSGIGSGGGGSGSGGSSSDAVVSKTLPSNWRSFNCGFFYEDFEVCGGTCAEGTCVNSGDSCYCKD